jgi:hypothetical protein
MGDPVSVINKNLSLFLSIFSKKLSRFDSTQATLLTRLLYGSDGYITRF